MAVEAGPLDELKRARVDLLRGQIALEQRRPADAGRLLVSAARRLEPLDANLARETHLEALGAAMAADLEIPGGLWAAAQAARAAPPGPEPPRAVDVLLDGFAMRLTEGYGAAAPTLTRALEMLLDLDIGDEQAGHWLWLAGGRGSMLVALELWDAEAWHALATRKAQFARNRGALIHLQLALSFLGRSHLLAGDLTTAGLMIEEDRLIAEATGNAALGNAQMTLAAWRGQELLASELIEANDDEAAARGWTSTAYARAVLYNGLGRHDAARDAARPPFERDALGVRPVPRAGARRGRVQDRRNRDRQRHARVAVRTHPRDVIRVGARNRSPRPSVLSDGETADRLYRESIARLGQTRVAVEVARGHLLYGEWLRRENRRVDAREQLRTAHAMLSAMGVEAFAERACRELKATGETVRKRTVETRDELTPQEALIARLARDGLSNPEIGTRLFISPRTVKYHLRKVFIKLEISSRNELDRVLPGDAATPPPR